MFKVKVLVVGPCQSGKTTVSNFLADATDQASGEYHPTQGCRIVEFECNTGGRQNVEVEMWDCSGDRRFETCWPAMAKDTNGIVFVFNPDMPNHDKDMEGWYDYFVAQQNLKDSQCIAFAHHKPGANERERSQLSDTFTKVQTVPTNIEDDGDDVRNHFNNYLSRIISALSDNREKEELSIMNN
ncbi:intraflagellar transport protein 22 homolog [Pecten maximus]|uniref:intraflagellar transport protein 22 homolog n=1 Tax=Pecten maximus TaxID=6579 RepID=UPI001457F46D|nr:intraflagellar transport protein 22 homolog [Pecten maximus]